MKEKEILSLLSEKHAISELNDMQLKVLQASSSARNILLLSPTGSGKTIAFILPVLKWLNPPSGRVQVVVIAPSRELVIQIANVFKSLAPDFKVTELYGGHKVEDEVNSLSVTPDIVVATPGRLLDHAKRGNINLLPVRILVLDEFDKTLELGFEEDVRKIMGRLKNVSRHVLTSATRADVLPDFLNLENPVEFDFLEENSRLRHRLSINRVDADGRDKLESLYTLLMNLSAGNTPEREIIFVNHRESAERVAGFLKQKGVSVALYHGALDQRERETALSLFNNGSRPILVATDLAARGLDIKDVRNVIHYHQALTPEVYTHRNGRTARVDAGGDVYILLGPDEEVKEFAEIDRRFSLDSSVKGPLKSNLETICINAGKKEKLSKGDILGFLSKECGIPGNEIGTINIFDHYSLVAVPQSYVSLVLGGGQNRKIKGKTRRLSLVG